MSCELSKAIELGLNLSKRIYYGKDAGSMSAQPRTASMMESYLPTAVMVYAEIYEPAVVDNPDVPSYQPYVHGRCEPPALIPLHMHGISLKADCYLDTAFVTISGAWRVHCVSAGKTCNCRLAVPMGEEGSVLGVEVESSLKSYRTELVSEPEKVASSSKIDGFLIKGRIYTLKIPQVDGGTEISVTVSWSQKLLFQDGKLSLNVPFTFPWYVFPVMKKLSKKESVLVNVNIGTRTEVLYECVTHTLKRIRHEAGKVAFSCDREVSTWSRNDFTFSYNVSSSDLVTGVLLQSPSLHDFDQREMFCFYLYPGEKKVFRKELVFLVDISASMQGSPLKNVKTALAAALLTLNPVDTFNIVVFNGNSSSFSPSMVSATKELIEKASEWIEMNFIAEGSTNISTPLNQAIDMISKTSDAVSIIFLITDGSVEDEKDICEAMKSQLLKGDLSSPRIWTFGIGVYCNHYFLQMLAHIGRGYYGAAFDVDSVNVQLERLISNASSVILADTNIDALKDLDSLEFHPFHIPDLSSGCPLFISGRYCGRFPEFVEVGGTLADSSSLVIQAKVQHAKDIPLDRVFARRQIHALTSHAWFTGSKTLEEKAMKLSLQTRIPSEYTSTILIEIYSGKLFAKSDSIREEKILFLQSPSVGFGDLVATVANRPPENAEPKLYETQEMILKAASDCCGKMVDCCCCMCFIHLCSRLNDQCAIALSQLCTVLACFGCIEVCCDLCIGE